MESGRIECLASRRILSSDRIQIGSRPEKTGSKGNPIIARVSYSRIPLSPSLSRGSRGTLAPLPRQSRAIYNPIEKATD